LLAAIKYLRFSIHKKAPTRGAKSD